MAVLTFKGGVHPHNDGKALSKSKPVTTYMPKGNAVYPISQHIGAPANPIVNVGDRVLAGQKIAEAGGFVSANIHSAVSGTVKAIEPRRVANGNIVKSIVIENDGQFEKADPIPVKPLSELSREEIIEIVKEAGVVGRGGARFPSHVKLAPKEPEKIDYIIVNGAECEPYLTSDYRRMMEEPEKIVEGLKIVLSLFDNAKGIIAIESNKLDAAAKIKDLVKDEPNIEVKVVYVKYPQGGERQLIYATTKRAINSSMLPADAGCIVDNIDTIYAIRNAVIEGQPLLGTIFTVTGDAVKEPQNFRILFGTDTNELIEAAGGFVSNPEKIISGGPMMGFSMFTTDVPVIKGNSSVLAFLKDAVSNSVQTNCINCGKCVGVCPEQLIPSKLAKLSDIDDLEGFDALHGTECIECGCCSYICPAKRDLAQSIKSMKKAVIASRKK